MNSLFSDAAAWSRIQFAFTIIYHYLFPQLTMGLAWFLVYWKWRALRTGDEEIQPGCAILGQDLWTQFRGWRGDRHSDGVSVRNELGRLLQICRRRHWTNAGDGRHVRLLSGKSPLSVRSFGANSDWDRAFTP